MSLVEVEVHGHAIVENKNCPIDVFIKVDEDFVGTGGILNSE